eukprot:8455776-Ditylum_brightwellii.AAC.1
MVAVWAGSAAGSRCRVGCYAVGIGCMGGVVGGTEGWVWVEDEPCWNSCHLCKMRFVMEILASANEIAPDLCPKCNMSECG